MSPSSTCCASNAMFLWGALVKDVLQPSQKKLHCCMPAGALAVRLVAVLCFKDLTMDNNVLCLTLLFVRCAMPCTEQRIGAPCLFRCISG